MKKNWGRIMGLDNKFVVVSLKCIMILHCSAFQLNQCVFLKSLLHLLLGIRDVGRSENLGEGGVSCNLGARNLGEGDVSDIPGY